MIDKYAGMPEPLIHLAKTNPDVERYLDDQAKEIQKLIQAGLTDPLTGLWNRRYFEPHLEAEFEKARRHGHDLAMLETDIDLFKKINSDYGHHPFGDVIIKYVAKAARSRPGDTLSRLGGEEFGLILPHTDLRGAEHYAEIIRQKVAKINVLGALEHDRDEAKMVLERARTDEQRRDAEVAYNMFSGALDAAAGKPNPALTVSTGVGVYPFRNEKPPYEDRVLTPGGLMRSTNNAMHLAKNTGRNRVKTIRSLYEANEVKDE